MAIPFWIKVSVKNGRSKGAVLYDRSLFWAIVILACIGFVMVTSASITVARDPFFYTKRDGLYLIASMLIAILVLRIPMNKWQQLSSVFLLISIILLIVVLFIGKSVNGATRWITVGPINIQPSEIAKLTLFLYLSSYLVRKVEEVRNNFWGFFKPMTVMLVLAILLLAQPDLGTVVVLFVTTLGLLFLAGAKLWQFIAIINTGVLAVILLILNAEYRVNRVMSYWDPWKDPFGAGYQLSQSLIAFGRGGLVGEGLGNSIQKQQYLPEAHTDFIFSIIAEEIGYLGVGILLLLLFFIAFKAMSIGFRALQVEKRFSGFLACAIGIWFSFQTFVNVGAVSGILPTKGLTFPLLSYGGSSLLVMTVAAMILLRIDFELRMTVAQAHIKGAK